MHTYTFDKRFSMEFESPNNWRLRIADTKKKATKVDRYECQTSTHRCVIQTRLLCVKWKSTIFDSRQILAFLLLVLHFLLLLWCSGTILMCLLFANGIVPFESKRNNFDEPINHSLSTTENMWTCHVKSAPTKKKWERRKHIY